MARANPFELLGEIGDEEPPTLHNDRPPAAAESCARRSGVTSRLAGRRWLSSPVSPPACPSGWKQVECRIASYNVLAKCYAKQVHFPRCKAEHLRWEVRRKALCEVICELGADIVCLQEVDNYEKFWAKEMRLLGYAGVYKQRNSGAKRDGCATFYRADRFEKVHVQAIEFDEVGTLPGQPAPDFQTHNVALLTLLRPIGEAGAQCAAVCVGNAHLFWDPSYEELKAAQARCLLERAAALAARLAPDAPLLLAGDFNSVPDSEVYRLLTRGAGLCSAYVAAGGPPPPPSSSSNPPIHATPSPPPAATPAGGSATPPPSTPPRQRTGGAAPDTPPPPSPASPRPPAAAGGAALGEGSAGGGGTWAAAVRPVRAGSSGGSGGGGKREGEGELVFARPLNPHSPVFTPPPAEGAGGAGARGAGGAGERRGAGTAPGQEPAFTNYRDTFHGTIDYILLPAAHAHAKDAVRGRGWAVGCLSMVSEAEAGRCGGGLPNARHPSDHLPIAADLLLHLPPPSPAPHP